MPRPACTIVLTLLACLAVFAVAPAPAQAQKQRLEGYSSRTASARHKPPDDSLPDGATGSQATRLPSGRVDVVCHEDAASLLDCLDRAEQNGSGTVDLPPNVLVQHVDDLFKQHLKFHDLDGDFHRYQGYRFVLSFRKLSTGELRRRRELRRQSQGLDVVGGALSFLSPVPLSPVFFLAESAQSESQRARASEDAHRRGAPQPGRSAVNVAAKEYVDGYRQYVDEADPFLEAYVVQTCYIAHPVTARTTTSDNATAVNENGQNDG
ncbi:hypothetical protein [Desulfohalovibrio reitneri]|uniref:hypothetical protein n=1 Tax=Desulfohalovibrio reitneri TaxID=1307759 RepID=UPI0004A76DD6|nr:hypothetical protein [Desulfohalovibrio reitneri]